MAVDNPHLDSEEFDLMRAEVFDIAASSISFHNDGKEPPRIVQAARAVMVDGMRPADAADKFGFPRERISEAVARIRDKWTAICTENGWVTETFSLSPRLAELIRQIETEAIDPLRREAALKRKTRVAKVLKVAEKKTPYRNKPAHKK